MDNFERHVRENASQFDQFKADRSKIWKNITEQLKKDPPKVVPFWKRPVLRIAASFFLLLGLASFMGFHFLTKNDGYGTNYSSSELLEIDSHYQDLVAYQIGLIENEPKLSEIDREEFLSFMTELDEEYRELRAETKNNINNKKILKAIVANYKKRIQLIENLLQQLNDDDTKETTDGYIF